MDHIAAQWLSRCGRIMLFGSTYRRDGPFDLHQMHIGGIGYHQLLHQLPHHPGSLLHHGHTTHLLGGKVSCVSHRHGKTLAARLRHAVIEARQHQNMRGDNTFCSAGKGQDHLSLDLLAG
jgi:hypothetical protein